MKALTKELVDKPDFWRLSVLIGSTGIDVFAHPFVGEGSAVAEHIAYDASVSSKASALEEAVYANPLLLVPFGKTDIVVACSEAATVPVDVEPGSLESLLSMDSDTTLMESPLNPREKVIYSIDRGIANFLGRTYDRATPVHVLSVLNRYYMRRGMRGNSSRMYLNVGADSLDVLVYNRLGLAAARHIDKPSIDECAYYALAFFNQSGLDPDYDEIYISGSQEQRHQLAPLLSRYVNNVLPAIFPSTIYHGDATVLKAAYPLVVLPLCE